MIDGLSKDEFAAILKLHLSPTAPIQSQERLYGRDTQLRNVEQALFSAGRTIFVYGDRGVGKTSLAQTAAFEHQASAHEPVFLACTPATTFAGLIRSAVAGIAEGRDASSSTKTHTTKLNLGALSHEQVVSHRIDGSLGAVPLNLNEAMSLLKAASVLRQGPTVVVVDEFDRITSDVERVNFADFIKQVGDQALDVRFIFCGVAESLEKLLGAHASCYRYVVGVELPRLTWEARWEIIDGAAKAFGVSIGERPRFRIAAISDGFPHYIHLICERLFWEMFNDAARCHTPTVQHYRDAVTSAVLGIEQHLKAAYDRATMKRTDSIDYEEALWAVADHQDLVRHADSIHDSYAGVVRKLGDSTDGPAMGRVGLSRKLGTLRKPSCGAILHSPARGYYQFRESIIRGYVRLRAEEQGVELALDYAGGAANSIVWAPRGARRSRRGDSPGRSRQRG